MTTINARQVYVAGKNQKKNQGCAVNGNGKQCQCRAKHVGAMRVLADDWKWWPKIFCLCFTQFLNCCAAQIIMYGGTSSLASYPGPLPPAFVACSTNMGEGLVTLITCSNVPGCVEEWHIPRKTASKWVCYRLQTRTVERLSAWHQTVLATFLGFRKPLYSCTEGICHSSTRPGMSVHRFSFTRPSPALVLQVTNAGVRRPGYKATSSLEMRLNLSPYKAGYGPVPSTSPSGSVNEELSKLKLKATRHKLQVLP